MAAASLLLLLLLLLFLVSSADIPNSDVKNLILIKSSLSNPPSLSSWSETALSPCSTSAPWLGVICDGPAVTGLRLESLSLSGYIDIFALSKLNSLRALSLSNNSFSGPIPLINKLDGLKTIYLSHNNFTGQIPNGLFAGMGHLKKLHLSNNQFTGPIPSSLSKASFLMELDLKNNRFSGEIPALELPSLQLLDLSNNELTGPVPAALAAKFKEDSFSNNPGLCGPPLAGKPCQPMLAAAGVAAPAGGGGGKSGGAVVSMFILAVLLLAAAAVMVRGRRAPVFDTLGVENGEMEAGKMAPTVKKRGVSDKGIHQRRVGSSIKGEKGPSGMGGDLVMVNEEKGVFVLGDLMKAAAEVIGNGGLGSAYKAVMGNGTVVVVKRMKEMNKLGKENFELEMRRLGRLRHPNVLTPLAYHHRKEEKLLVYEFVPKGSLLYILHGDRGTDHAALDWLARLKILLGIAQGMTFLHSELKYLDVPHGNLKSGNVLLAPDFVPLLVDYGFVPLVNPSVASQALIAYRSPETLTQRRLTPKSDVYCFGIIILELLTGKFPSQYLNNTKGGTDVIAWAHSAISENRVAELIDPAIITTAKASTPEMERLILVGVACVDPNPDERPDMREALRRIEEIVVDANNRVVPKAKDGYAESLASEGSARRTTSIKEGSRSSGDHSSFAIS